MTSGEALGASWLASLVPDGLLGNATTDTATPGVEQDTFEFLTPEQAVEVEAMTAVIIPSDDMPGAREARAVHYIDHSLATFAAQIRGLYARGLESLQSEVAQLFPSARKFSELGVEQQIEALKTIEDTPFFRVVVGGTIVGCFADPSYGGNHQKSGWKILGFEGRPMYEPPFGYYDLESQHD